MPANENMTQYRTDHEGFAEILPWNGKPLPKREYDFLASLRDQASPDRWAEQAKADREAVKQSPTRERGELDFDKER